MRKLFSCQYRLFLSRQSSKARNLTRFMEYHELGSYFQEAVDNDGMRSHPQGIEPVLNQGTFSVPSLIRCDNIYLSKYPCTGDYVPSIIYPIKTEIFIVIILSLLFHCMLGIHIICCFGLVRVTSKGHIWTWSGSWDTGLWTQWCNCIILLKDQGWGEHICHWNGMWIFRPESRLWYAMKMANHSLSWILFFASMELQIIPRRDIVYFPSPIIRFRHMACFG